MKKLKYIISILLILLGINLRVSAQNNVGNKEVSGIVYESATGKPFAGAKVSIPGVTSVITGEDGKFLLKKSTKGAYIEVYAPGYTTKRVPLVENSNIRVFLLDDTFRSRYDYIATPFEDKLALTGTQAISAHDNRDDYKLGSTTIESILQVNNSGVNILSRNGMPGAGGNMFINGFTSLNATSQPLIVINGIPYDNTAIYSLITGNTITPLSDIDVKDVESVTILKDGTSIYGSKGANGVILINTLRGKDAATRISFYSYAGVNMEPASKYKMMNASHYKSYLTDMLLSNGLSVNEVNALPYINNQKPVFENWGVSGNSDYYRYNQATNWQDEVFNNSINQNYHLNITGGNEAALYAISVGYLGHQGSVKNTEYNRYTTRVDARFKMTNWFKLNANMGLVYSERTLAYEGLNKNFNPVYAGLVKAPFTSAYVYNIAGEKTPNLEDADIFNISNPLTLTDKTNLNNNRFRFFGDFNGIISFNKYLEASLLIGLTTDKASERIFLPDAGVYHDALPSAVVTNESKQLRNSLIQINTDARLTYKRTFNEIHTITARLGSRYQNSSSELDWGLGYNTSSDEMKTLGDGKSTMAQLGGSLGSWKSISNYLNVEYGLLNRYFISFNGAMDASSRFGADANGLKLFNSIYGLFPSINGAWLISSEKFMKNAECIDVLKLRAGYAITGNDDIGNYTSRYYFNSQSMLGAYGLVRGNIPNSSLQWETNKKATLGIDASFMHERLNVSADIYQSTTSDLINIKSIGSATGIGYAVMNDGSLRNKGIDLAINCRMLDHKDLKIDLGGSISSFKNKLLSMSTDLSYYTYAGGTIRSKVGAPVAEFYGYKTDGIFRTTQEANAANLSIQNTDGSKVAFKAGDVKFVDRNNDNVINEKDMTVIGKPTPDFFGSINGRIQWKHFSLLANFTYSVGNDVYNALRANLESMSNTDNQTIAAIYRWKTEGQNTNTPKAVYGDPMGNSRFSDRWIEDGSYIRLKTINIAYDFPVSTGIINSLQVYVTGNNLLTFSKYLGYDPEFSSSQNPLYYGIDNGSTPQQRTILLGLKIGL